MTEQQQRPKTPLPGSYPGWGIGAELYHYADIAYLHVMPVYGHRFIRLPKACRREVQWDRLVNKWGLLWRWDSRDDGPDLRLSRGGKCYVLRMPWGYEGVRLSVLMADGSWGPKAGYATPGRFEETYDYVYTTANGTVQLRKATVTAEELEWRRRCLRWCPPLAMVKRFLRVAFDGEVGEGVGSDRGGTSVCRDLMRKGETPLECLRRMEASRKFE